MCCINHDRCKGKIKDKPASAQESSVFDFQLQFQLFSWQVPSPFSVSIILIIKIKNNHIISNQNIFNASYPLHI